MCPNRSCSFRRLFVVSAVLMMSLLAGVAAADVLVLTDGTRLEGTIRKTGEGYTITAADGTDTPSTPPSYTIRATPVSGGAQVPDGELTLTHMGAKTRAGNPGW